LRRPASGEFWHWFWRSHNSWRRIVGSAPVRVVAEVQVLVQAQVATISGAERVALPEQALLQQASKLRGKSVGQAHTGAGATRLHGEQAPQQLGCRA